MQEAAAEGQSAVLKKEKSELDRASKETLKPLELMTKMTLEDQKNKLAEKQLKGKMLEKSADIENKREMKIAELESQRKGDDNA